MILDRAMTRGDAVGRSSKLRRLTVLLVVLLMLALASCAGSVAVPASNAKIRESWQGCKALRHTDQWFEQLELDGQGSVPKGFRPTVAVRCVEQEAGQPDASVALMTIEQRAASRLQPLLEALALPSQHRRKFEQVACTSDLWRPPWLFLMDAGGRWIYPEVPLNVCEKPRPEFSAAYDALSFAEHAREVVRTVRTAAATRAGCEQQATDMVGYATRFEHPERVALVTDPFAGRPVRVCRYRVPASERGAEKAQGNFVGGGLLTAARAVSVVHALLSSAAAPAGCDRRSETFALLWRSDQKSPQVYVELDGCRRVLVYWDTPTIAAASAGLLQLIRT
jgi:hypothetical protein